MPEPHYLPASDVLHGWREGVLTGKPPTLYPAGAGELGRVEIGPGLVTLLGGAPGSGKTALTMQLATDALRLTENLRVCVCNVEMAPPTLLDRQLARLSGIDLTTIRHRNFDATHAGRIDQGLATLEPLAERLCFVLPPFDLANVAASADAFDAGLLVLDYVQRIKPPGEHGDKRGSVDALMHFIRQFADAEVAILAVAAVSRSKDSKGRSSYGEGLNLASFRESSELEFGADDAFLLLPDGDGGTVTLKHLKSRHGEPKDIPLHFDRRLQRFTPAAADPPRPDNGQLRSELAALWNRTPLARDEEGGDG